MLDELISPVQFPAGSTLYPVPVRGSSARSSVPTILTALITAVPATVAACTGFMAWKAQRDTNGVSSPATGYYDGDQTAFRDVMQTAIGTLVKAGDVEAAHTLGRKWDLPVPQSVG